LTDIINYWINTINVKTELSSVDVRVLAAELRERLLGLRVEKAYQVGEHQVVLRLHGRGSADLVASSNYLCVSRYRRPVPQAPSSFAMQLRKRLGGAFLRDFIQHGFDRIVELRFDEYVLVIELFSKGNVILCDKEMKIIGLLDWQRWKDRTLGVGRPYEYPPQQVNPFDVDEAAFMRIMGESERPIAATLATKLSLGGYFAERICADAGFDPKALWSDVDGSVLWGAFEDFRMRVDLPAEARLFDDNVLPFGEGGDPQPSFNDAVDEYFSSRESVKLEAQARSGAEDALKKLEDILARQREAVVRSNEGAVIEQAKGDLLYQRMGDVQAVVSHIKEARRAGRSDKEILDELREWGIVSGLDGLTLTLDL